MSKIETTIEEIKNGESTLILKQGILYKIIEASFQKRKEPIIKMLHDSPDDIP